MTIGYIKIEKIKRYEIIDNFEFLENCEELVEEKKTTVLGVIQEKENFKLVTKTSETKEMDFDTLIVKLIELNTIQFNNTDKPLQFDKNNKNTFYSKIVLEIKKDMLKKYSLTEKGKFFIKSFWKNKNIYKKYLTNMLKNKEVKKYGRD